MTSPSRPHADHTRRRRPRAAALALSGLALTALLAVGCSSDDDAADASADTTTTVHDGAHDDGGDGDSGGAPEGPAPLEGAAMSADACGHFANLSASMVAGEGTVAGPSLEAFPESLPSDLQPQGSSVVDALSAAFEGDPEAMSSPEFELAFGSVGDAMWEGCEAQSRLDVTGVDYGFEGLPSKVPSGMMALRFTNGTSSAEPHELLILARPTAEMTPIEEIAEMSPDEIMTDYPMVGVAFAETADASSTSFIDLPAGSYIVICTIPVGGGETGDPHAAHGMIAELEAV